MVSPLTLKQRSRTAYECARLVETQELRRLAYVVVVAIGVGASFFAPAAHVARVAELLSCIPTGAAFVVQTARYLMAVGRFEAAVLEHLSQP